MKCSFGISNFLKEISCLSHSTVFFYAFALFTQKVFLSLLALLWNSAFRWIHHSCAPLPFTSLLFSAMCKASSDNHLAFLHFFFLGMVLITASSKCYKSPHIVLPALCLSDLIPWIYLSLPLFDHKGFWFRSYLNGLVVFPTFLNLSLNLAIRISWSEPQSAPSLVYADCIELLHSLATKNIINLISVLTIWWCSCVESDMAGAT